MTDHYDALETRDPGLRETELFSRLPDVLRKALAAPAYAERLRGIDPAAITSRAALAALPVLRKSELPALHKAAPPFGGFVAGPLGSFGRLFTTPTPGAARARCSRPVSGPATWCSTPSATI